MILKKLLIISVIILFLPLTSFAQAEEKIRYEELDIELEHDLNGQPGTTGINVLDQTSQREIDTFPDVVKNSNGLYWGNLFPASTINIGRDFNIYITTSLEIPPEQIASGASEFWLRIPIDGDTVSSFRLQIDGDITNSIGTYYERQGESPNTETVKWTPRGVFIRIIHPLSTSYKYGWTPEGIAEDLDEYYPNNYTFIFNLLEITPRYEQVSLLFTEERYGNSTIYLEREDQYFIRNINASLAWSFMFLQGLPKAGLFSFDFSPTVSNVDTTLITPGEPYYTRSYVTVEREIPVSLLNGSYVTLQIPFIGTTIWHVRIILGSGTFDTVGSPFVWSGNISAKKDMLTVSAPYAVNTTGLSSDVRVTCLFSPESDIRLLSAFDSDMRNNWDTTPRGYERTYITRFRDFVYTDGLTEWTKEFSVFCNIYTTNGAYAEYTWIGQSKYIDFGWGTGYIHPGEMELFLLMDNQTEIYWSGNIEVLYQLSQREAWELSRVAGVGDTEDRDLLQKIYDALLATGHDIWDGIKGIISTLWSYIKHGLEVIGNFVINLVGKIIAFIREMVEFIGNILKGTIYVMPIALMVAVFKFTGDPAGFFKDTGKLRTQATGERTKHIKRKTRVTERKIDRINRRSNQ